jgi:cell wall-associated NlpC family hydrolase
MGHAGRDSRECPGPISEATLHRPSPSRAITAGAIALATIAPAFDSAEHAAEAVQAVPAPDPADHVTEAAPALPAPVMRSFDDRATTTQRASRAATRGGDHVRPAVARRASGPARTRVAVAARKAHKAAVRKARHAPVRNRPTVRKKAHVRKAHTRAVIRSVVTKHAAVKRGQRLVRLGKGMTAVIAYAKSQVGKRYVSGGEGLSGFDCSGLTKRAYAQAGVRLPHSSRAQAARARSISRSKARPGDLVVGPGHVGIYMGRGMMIDAGNHRTGVVYRKLYSGLRVERF